VQLKLIFTMLFFLLMNNVYSSDENAIDFILNNFVLKNNNPSSISTPQKSQVSKTSKGRKIASEFKSDFLLSKSKKFKQKIAKEKLKYLYLFGKGMVRKNILKKKSKSGSVKSIKKVRANILDLTENLKKSIDLEKENKTFAKRNKQLDSPPPDQKQINAVTSPVSLPDSLPDSKKAAKSPASESERLPSSISVKKYENSFKKLERLFERDRIEREKDRIERENDRLERERDRRERLKERERDHVKRIYHRKDKKFDSNFVDKELKEIERDERKKEKLARMKEEVEMLKEKANLEKERQRIDRERARFAREQERVARKKERKQERELVLEKIDSQKEKEKFEQEKAELERQKALVKIEREKIEQEKIKRKKYDGGKTSKNETPYFDLNEKRIDPYDEEPQREEKRKKRRPSTMESKKLDMDKLYQQYLDAQ